MPSIHRSNGARIHSGASVALGVFLLAGVFAYAAPAQGPAGAGVPPDPPSSIDAPGPPAVSTGNSGSAAKNSVADFTWLVGRWQGSWGPRVAEQVWTPPKAGAMTGTFRADDGDKTLVIELFSLLETPDGIELRLRHFTPALAAWEHSGPVILKLSAMDSKKVVFENLHDGEPQRIIFKRMDADTYVSRSEIVPSSGDPQIVEITYHRQK